MPAEGAQLFAMRLIDRVKHRAAGTGAPVQLLTDAPRRDVADVAYLRPAASLDDRFDVSFGEAAVTAWRAEGPYLACVSPAPQR